MTATPHATEPTAAPTLGNRCTVLTSAIEAPKARLHSSTKRKLKESLRGQNVIQVHCGTDGKLRPNSKHDTFLLQASTAIGLQYVEVRMDAPHGMQPAADKEIQAHVKSTLGYKVSDRDVQQWRRMYRTIGRDGIAAHIGTSLDDRNEQEHLCRLAVLCRPRADELIDAAKRGQSVSAIAALESFLQDRERRLTDKVHVAIATVGSFSLEDKFDFTSGMISQHLAQCTADSDVTTRQRLQTLTLQRERIAVMKTELQEFDDAAEVEIACLIAGAAIAVLEGELSDDQMSDLAFNLEHEDPAENDINTVFDIPRYEQDTEDGGEGSWDYQTMPIDCGTHNNSTATNYDWR